LLDKLQRKYLKLDSLEIPRQVFTESAFAGVNGTSGDLLVDFIIRKEAFSGLNDLYTG